MTYLQALWLALVEGLTEFVPVSSTGHLILASRALGLEGEGVNSFIDAIQSGAVLAIVALFPERFKRLLDPRDRLFRSVALTTAPAVLLALAFEKTIKAALFKPLPVALALAVGALLMAAFSRRDRGGADYESLSWKAALMIGLAQCLALWPGMSRAACALLGGLAVGLSARKAAEYSFLAAVPLLFAATAYELLRHSDKLQGLWGQFALGFVVSFLTAYAAVRYFLKALDRWGLWPFAAYRLALSPLVWVFFS